MQDANGIVAYTNMIPSYIPDQRSIDHIRHIPGMPSIGMHYLLKSVIQDLGQKGVATFNLGLSPLSGIEGLEDPTILERLLASLKSFGSRYYSFAGLEQFKNKFKPDWQPRYILYQGSPTTLLRVSAALNKATALPGNRSKFRIFVIMLSIIAGIGYVSFLLVYPLGLAGGGLASELGAKGAPYNWLFNGLDIVVGGIIVYLAYLGVRRSEASRTRICYGLFALGGLGNILAALVPLGSTVGVYYAHWDSRFLHGFFSAVSIFGFFAALALCAIQPGKWRWPLRCLLTVLALLTIASAAAIDQSYAGTLQKLQLATIAISIIWIGSGVATTPSQKHD